MVAVAASPVQQSSRQAVAAAVIGNVLEWYDFGVYGYMAAIIGRTFFPSGNPVTSLLASFAVFGIGFVARPIGGIVIGRIGDVKGRKAALVLCILMMAMGTVLIGVVPTYAAIGIAAPVLVLIARLLQGFSAGGEWGGSTAFLVEWADEGERGFLTSFQQASVMSGLLLGSGVAALVSTVLPADAVEGWGWRIPFLLGGILGPVGMWMRMNIGETPAYRKAMAKPASQNAAAEIGGFWQGAQAFGFTVLWTVAVYILLTYMPTFAEKYLHLSRTAALWSNTLGLLVLVVAIPIMGRLSDRVGRKPLLLTCCIAFIVLPYPVFSWLLTGVPLGAVMAVQIFWGIAIALYSGAGPAAIAEIFPTKGRSLWMSTGYSLSVAVFGGFAPFLATWFIEQTGSPISPVFYVMAAAVISLLVVVRLKETAHSPLR